MRLDNGKSRTSSSRTTASLHHELAAVKPKLGRAYRNSGSDLCTRSVTAARPLTRKRCSLGSSGGGLYPRHSQLWAELKRLARRTAAKLSYMQVSTGQLEPMVEEARKAK